MSNLYSEMKSEFKIVDKPKTDKNIIEKNDTPIPNVYLDKIFKMTKTLNNNNSLYNSLSPSFGNKSATELRVEVVGYINDLNRDVNKKITIPLDEITNITKEINSTPDEMSFFCGLKKCTIVNIRIDKNFNVIEFTIIFPSLNVVIIAKGEFEEDLKFFYEDIFKNCVFILMRGDEDNYHWDSLVLKSKPVNVEEEDTESEKEKENLENKEKEEEEKRIREEEKRIREQKRMREEIIKTEEIKKKEGKEDEENLKKDKKKFSMLKFNVASDYINEYEQGISLNDFLLSFSKKFIPSSRFFRYYSNDDVIFSNNSYDNYDMFINHKEREKEKVKIGLVKPIIEYLLQFYDNCIYIINGDIDKKGDIAYGTKLGLLNDIDNKYIKFYSIFFKKIQENTINYIEEKFLKNFTKTVTGNKYDYKKIGEEINNIMTIAKQGRDFSFINNNKNGWNSYIIEFLKKYYADPYKYSFKEDDFNKNKLLNYIKEKYDENSRMSDEERKKMEEEREFEEKRKETEKEMKEKREIEEEEKRDLEERNKKEENKKRLFEEKMKKKNEEKMKTEELEKKKREEFENKKKEEENKKRIEEEKTRKEKIEKEKKINSFENIELIKKSEEIQKNRTNSYLKNIETDREKEKKKLEKEKEQLKEKIEKIENGRITNEKKNELEKLKNESNKVESDLKLIKQQERNIESTRREKEMKKEREENENNKLKEKERKIEEERKMEEERKRKMEEERKIEEEKRRIEEEKRRIEEEKRRIEEEKRKIEEEKRRIEEEEKRRIEEKKKKDLEKKSSLIKEIKGNNEQKKIEENKLEEEEKKLKDLKEDLNDENNLKIKELEEIIENIKNFSTLNFDLSNNYIKKYDCEGDLNNFLLSFLKVNIPPDFVLNKIDDYNVIFNKNKRESYNEFIGDYLSNNTSFKSYNAIKFIMEYLIQFYDGCMNLIKIGITVNEHEYIERHGGSGVDKNYNFEILDYNKQFENFNTDKDDINSYLIFFKRIQEYTINYIESLFIKSLEVLIRGDNYIEIGERLERYREEFNKNMCSFYLINKTNGWHSYILDFLIEYYRNSDNYQYKYKVFKNTNLLNAIDKKKKYYEEERLKKIEEEKLKKIEKEKKKKLENEEIMRNLGEEIKRIKDEENIVEKEKLQEAKDKLQEKVKEIEKENNQEKKKELEEEKKLLEEELKKIENFSTLKFDLKNDYNTKYNYKKDLNKFLLSFSRINQLSDFKYNPKPDYQVIFNEKNCENYDDFIIEYHSSGGHFKSLKDVNLIITLLTNFYGECLNLTSLMDRNLKYMDYVNNIKGLEINDEIKNSYLIFFKKIQEYTTNYLENQFLKDTLNALNGKNYEEIGKKLENINEGLGISFGYLGFLKHNKYNWNSYVFEFLEEYYKNPEKYAYKEVDFKNFGLLDYIKKMKELKKQEELKKIEDLKKQEEFLKKQEELKKLEELKKIEDLKKQEEFLKKQEELKKLEELKKIEDLKKQEEFLKKQEELKKLEELKKIEDLKKQEEFLKKQEELKKLEQDKNNLISKNETYEKNILMKLNDRKVIEENNNKLKNDEEIEKNDEEIKKNDKKINSFDNMIETYRNKIKENDSKIKEYEEKINNIKV